MVKHKVLPLRSAYPFALAKGLDSEIATIEEISPPSDHSNPSDIRRGYMVHLLKEHGIFDEFVREHWPDGATSWGTTKVAYYLGLRDQHENRVRSGGSSGDRESTADTDWARRGGEWSRLEDEAAVTDYVAMLKAEIRGEPYNKAKHRRALQPLLDGRSRGAIEYKHQNISAVLIDLGYPYIDGYKPALNYQQLLFEVVEDRLRTDRELTRLVEADVERPPPPLEVDDVLSTLVAPPPPRDRPDRSYERSRPAAARRAVDFLEMEARNSALGLEGERYVLGYERARLAHAGKPNLADRIEHTSVEEDAGAGFDVRSYETDGSDRFIEVKTTAYGIYTPLYLSRNELRVSQEKDDRYHLYRAFQFRKSPRLFTVAGALDQTLRLEATLYVGRIG